MTNCGQLECFGLSNPAKASFRFGGKSSGPIPILPNTLANIVQYPKIVCRLNPIYIIGALAQCLCVPVKEYFCHEPLLIGLASISI